MKTTKLTTKEFDKLKQLQEKKNKERLINFILTQTDADGMDKKFSDSSLDVENDKRRIQEAVESFWENSNVRNTISRSPNKYEPIFTQDYYKEMFRLNNWNYTNVIAQKPWRAGQFTNEIIYYRFPKEVLSYLKILNPYIIPGVRQYKHHQYFTSVVRISLSNYIHQATELMKKFDDWDSFRIEYCRVYNVPYQLSLKL